MKSQRPPDRGEIIWLSFSRSAVHEQGGHRPAVVLSPKEYNAISGLAIVCPVTSKIKGYPWEVPLGESCGLDRPSAALADQVKSMAWKKRQTGFAGSVSVDTLEAITAHILPLIT